MNYKVIKTAPAYPDVLVHRDTDMDGNEIVRILAIGTVNGDEDQMTTEDITFADNILPHLYVTDFSIESAEAWCREEGMTV